jgi:sRNA-binding protein
MLITNFDNLIFLARGDGITAAVGIHLVDRFPNTFTYPPRPLAIGIRDMLMFTLMGDRARLRTAGLHRVTYDQLAEALHVILTELTAHPMYLAAQRAGRPRWGLHGPLGEVTEDEAAFARDRFRESFRRDLPFIPSDEQVNAWLRMGEAWDRCTSGAQPPGL